MDFRVIRIVEFRTALMTDEQALAAIDEMVAHPAPGWNALSDKRVAQPVDWMVLDVDPNAVRVAKDATPTAMSRWGRRITGWPSLGSVRATDGAAST